MTRHTPTNHSQGSRGLLFVAALWCSSVHLHTTTSWFSSGPRGPSSEEQEESWGEEEPSCYPGAAAPPGTSWCSSRPTGYTFRPGTWWLRCQEHDWAIWGVCVCESRAAVPGSEGQKVRCAADLP